MSEPKLEPCPFCGGNNLEMALGFSVPPLICNDCGGAISPDVDNEADLIAAWNTRAEPNKEGT